MVHCIYRGGTGYNFLKKKVFLSLKIDYGSANNADPESSGSALLAKVPIWGGGGGLQRVNWQLVGFSFFFLQDIQIEFEYMAFHRK